MSKFKLKPPPPIGRKSVKSESVSESGAAKTLQRPEIEPGPIRVAVWLEGASHDFGWNAYKWVWSECPYCGEVHITYILSGPGEDTYGELTREPWIPECWPFRGGWQVNPRLGIGVQLYDGHPERSARFMAEDSCWAECIRQPNTIGWEGYPWLTRENTRSGRMRIDRSLIDREALKARVFDELQRALESIPIDCLDEQTLKSLECVLIAATQSDPARVFKIRMALYKHLAGDPGRYREAQQ